MLGFAPLSTLPISAIPALTAAVVATVTWVAVPDAGLPPRLPPRNLDFSDSPTFVEAAAVVTVTHVRVIGPVVPRRPQMVLADQLPIAPAAFVALPWVVQPELLQRRVKLADVIALVRPQALATLAPVAPTELVTPKRVRAIDLQLIVPATTPVATGYAPFDQPADLQRRARLAPADMMLSVPAAARFAAWVADAPLPVRRKLDASVAVAVVPPNVYRPWIVEAMATVRPRVNGEAQLAVQQVPTQFVSNAWGDVWGGPARKPFLPGLQRANQPVLAVYSSVVVTYPDGWRIDAPQTKAPKGKPASEVALAVPVTAATPSGWSIVTDAPKPRPTPATAYQLITPAPVLNAWVAQADMPAARRRPLGEAALGNLIASAPVGWSIGGDVAAPRVKRAEQPNMVPLAPRSLQAAADLVWAGLAPRLPRKPQGEAVLPAQKFVVALIGDTQLWGFVSYRFRTIIPAAPQFAYPTVKVGTRIGSAPTLLGGSTAPTLYAASTNAGLFGVSTASQLLGASTAPGILGTSTEPDILGEV